MEVNAGGLDEATAPTAMVDVHPRHEWLIAFERMGVRVFSVSSFVQMLSGCLPFDGVTDVSSHSCVREGGEFRPPSASILLSEASVSLGL